jgi:DUF1016 N-terminal domain
MKELSDKIVALVEQARLQVAKVANSAMVFTYFQIGKMIVEELQNGERRAEYGTQLLETISADLNQKDFLYKTSKECELFIVSIQFPQAS